MTHVEEYVSSGGSPVNARDQIVADIRGGDSFSVTDGKVRSEIARPHRLVSDRCGTWKRSVVPRFQPGCLTCRCLQQTGGGPSLCRRTYRYLILPGIQACIMQLPVIGTRHSCAG